MRLLRVHARTPDTGIVDDQAAYNVNSAPNYHAISCTWGPKLPVRDIVVNEHVLQVQAACHSALWQAWLHLDQPASIRIDNISINQSDQDEKVYQVDMIADTSPRACETLVCIGPHIDDSEYLCRVVSQLGFPKTTTVRRAMVIATAV